MPVFLHMTLTGTRSRAPRVLSFMAGALLLAALASVVAFSDRGLDITDEADYLLSAQFPNEIRGSVTAAHFYTGLAFTACSGSVRCMRLGGLTLLLAAAGLLTFGLVLLVRPLMGPGPALLPPAAWFAVLGTGALLYYSWLPQTPSYNTINSAAVMASCGGLFGGLAMQERGKHFIAWPTFAAAGVATGFSLLVKVSTGVALLAVWVAVVAIWPGLRVRARLGTAAVIGAGVGVAFVVHFAALQSFSAWWAVLRTGLDLADKLRGGYDLGMLRRYVQEARDIVFAFGRWYWPVVPALVVATVGAVRDCRRPNVAHRLVQTAVGIAFALLFLMTGVRVGLGRFEALKYALFEFYVLTTLLLAACAVIQRLAERAAASVEPRAPQVRRLAILAASLLVLPLVSAAGTNNPIAANALFTMPPLFGAMCMLASHAHAVLPAAGRAAVLCGVTLVAAGQVISGPIVAPFRLHGSVLDQTVPTALGAGLTVLRLDADTHRFIVALRAAADVHGFRPGGDVLGLVKVPGLVFALGGRAPAEPWLNSGYLGSRAHNEYALSLVPAARLRTAFVLQTLPASNAAPDLARLGLDFPARYVLCWEGRWPVTGETVRLWKPM